MVKILLISVDGSEILLNQLRLVVYPVIYRALDTLRWCGISSINSISGLIRMDHSESLVSQRLK